MITGISVSVPVGKRPAKVSSPSSGDQPAEPQGMESFVPICPVNGPGREACANDGACPVGETEEEIWYAPPGQLAYPTGTTICSGVPAPIAPPASDASVAAALREDKDLVYPVPRLALRPAPTTLVNLATIVAVDGGQVRRTYLVTVRGVTLTVEATPAFGWSFGDGGALSTATPGRAYDGTAPADAPGYYLTHTYTRTGTYTVTETTTWSLRAHRGDTGAALTVGDAATTSASTMVTVKQSRARLTGNA